MAGEIIVFVTCQKGEAENLAKPLVEEGLAACVNIISGLTSLFFWEGKLCRESEDLLIIKSIGTRFDALQRRIKELHPYETPEIVSLSIEDGYKPYLDWLNSNVTARE